LASASASQLYPGAAELWPTLIGSASGVGGLATLTLHNGAVGLYALAIGTGTLPTPLTLGPEFYYGVLIDPSLPYLLMSVGSTNAAGIANRQYAIPNDQALSGAAIPWQAWATHGFFAPYTFASFTNLAVMQIP
jgi:hypothetical protein